MADIALIVNQLRNRHNEEDWFEFKENWFEPAELGAYISALSNSAAMLGKDNAYFVWGIHDMTHELMGTDFDYHRDVKKEPLEHYLARQITPDIGFSFSEDTIEGKRIVVLTIPAARTVPTAFDGVRFMRIGSSKVNLGKYPERESRLFSVLRNGLPTLETVEAHNQELSFRKLFLYYEDKGIILKKETFRKNLGLLTSEGKYNLLAQLLSDNSEIPVRVSIFKGINKAAPLYSVREFGNLCILISLDKVLEYGDVLNIIQADETNRIVERKEVPLFDADAFREAIVNAFVHNNWIDGNAPMITVFTDRIEILSRGTLAPKQTVEGFFLGESVPVNQKLSDIFLQLHISERSGRGVPVITEAYGRNAFDFRENSIVVTIPFKRIKPTERNKAHPEVSNKPNITMTQQRILGELRNNPNITQNQLAQKLELSRTTIQENIRILQKKDFIERIGAKKKGYWNILTDN